MRPGHFPIHVQRDHERHPHQVQNNVSHLCISIYGNALIIFQRISGSLVSNTRKRPGDSCLNMQRRPRKWLTPGNYWCQLLKLWDERECCIKVIFPGCTEMQLLKVGRWWSGTSRTRWTGCDETILPARRTTWYILIRFALSWLPRHFKASYAWP